MKMHQSYRSFEEAKKHVHDQGALMAEMEELKLAVEKQTQKSVERGQSARVEERDLSNMGSMDA